MNATRLAVAAAAFSALAIVACTAGSEETPSVEVKQGTVDPTCIRGGTTCGTVGTTSGTYATSTSGGVLNPGTSSGTTSGTSGKGGYTSGFVTSSSGMLDPGTSGAPPRTLVPPKGDPPISCGDACRPIYDEGALIGCDCFGGGNGIQSGIVCPIATPCRYNVFGSYRCYQVDYWTGECR